MQAKAEDDAISLYSLLVLFDFKMFFKLGMIFIET